MLRYFLKGTSNGQMSAATMDRAHPGSPFFGKHDRKHALGDLWVGRIG